MRRIPERAAQYLVLTCIVSLSACGDDGESASHLPTAPPAHSATRTSTATPPTAVPPTPTSITLPTATRPPASASPTATAAPTAPATSPPPSATPTATEAAPSDAERIASVGVSETWSLPGLTAEVQVLRTEANVPHIYASNRRDLAFVQGFVIARDRYFMMDLTRRLALGRVCELIGDAGLPTDLESRLTGMTLVADRIAAAFSPEQAEIVGAYAAGVNAYIDEVVAGRLPAPSELGLAGLLLGTSDPARLMAPFTRRDIAAMLAVVLYQSSFDTGDVARDAAERSLAGAFTGAPFATLRRAGAYDVLATVEPLFPVASTVGFGLEQGDAFTPGPLPASSAQAQIARGRETALPHVFSTSGPDELIGRTAQALQKLHARLRRRPGFGSNAWAVAGSASRDGSALLSGDGHLMLDIPAIFYQIGLDTAVFGGGDIHQVGLTIPGLPIMAVGTNGRVAWSQTQLYGDATDWYREQIFLDAGGLPVESLFRGEHRALDRSDESYVIADVPVLGSVGRTEVIPLWSTFDGRRIVEIEGRVLTDGEMPGPGEATVRTLGGTVVPGDRDGDGVVSAISVDYTAFDAERVLDGSDGFGRSADIFEFRAAARNLIAFSQNIIAADSGGSILYTTYHAVPCRAHLEREPGGRFAAGAHPQRLIDGTRFGGFTVPHRDGRVDASAAGADPQRCLVPFDSTPQAINPSRGYVFTANNDPGHVAFDGVLDNDPWYIGGPWDAGFRAFTIERQLAQAVQSGEADIARMAAIQGNHQSRTGEIFTAYLLEAIAHARFLAGVDRPLRDSEQRIVELYVREQAAADQAEARLRAWADRGFQAASGVETFYHAVGAGEREDAVATMIFNAWLARLVRGVWDDEALPESLFLVGNQTRLLLVDRFLAARGGSGEGIPSHNPATGESAFFDVLDTPEVETSREIVLGALADALAFLRSAPLPEGRGGFGTASMNAWLWGLRHTVRFESLLAPFLGDDPRFALFTAPFAIDTRKLPLGTLPPSDPRAALRWFPRPGDNWNVDAGHPGLSGTDFSYGDGPVMRMVIALKDGHVEGQNIIPGGQSGLIDSPYFSDQAALWLGNRTLPLRFAVADVVSGARGREVYRPGTRP